MVEGMSAEDARTMARIGEDMRACISRVPGADQDEQRARAFTMIAAVATASMGHPVVVNTFPDKSEVRIHRADGKVQVLPVRDDAV